MTTYIIVSILIGIICSVIGRTGVHNIGNYENIWGYLMIWSIPVSISIGLLLAIFL